MLPKRCSVFLCSALYQIVSGARIVYRRWRWRESERQRVEGRLVELVPAGGDRRCSGHQAGAESTYQHLAALVAYDVDDLLAIGHCGEHGVEGEVGFVDLGEDADPGEPGPVVIVDAGEGADAGDGVAWADAEGVQRMRGVEGGGVVPSCGRVGYR